MSFIDFIKRKFHEPEPKLPIPGEKTWILKIYKIDPWPKDNLNLVYAEILDVKAGWVRYKLYIKDVKMSKDALFQDNRLELPKFLQCYMFEEI